MGTCSAALVGTSINLVLLFVFTSWRPQFCFDTGEIRGLLAFSGHILASNLLNHFGRNALHLIVGPAAGAAVTGTVAMGSMIAWLPVAQFTSAATRAIFPAFSQIQDSVDRLRSGLTQALELVCLLTFPALAGLAIVANDAVPLLLGNEWRAAAPVISVFCMLSAVQSFAFVVNAALLARGNSKVTMYLSVVNLVAAVAALWVFRHADAFTVSIAIVFSTSATLLLGFSVAVRLLGYAIGSALVVLGRPAACCAFMAFVLLIAQEALRSAEPILRLVALIVIGVLAYGFATAVWNRAAVLRAVGLAQASLPGMLRRTRPAAP